MIDLKANAVVESLSNMILVHAFGAGTKLEERYAQLLVVAKRAGIQKAVAASMQAGLLYFIAYSSNALAYWQGSRQIANTVSQDNSQISVGAIYTVIFILVDATIILSTVAPFIQLFGAAVSAFAKLENTAGEKAQKHRKNQHVSSNELSQSSIHFHNVSFVYPSRPSINVLRNLSMSVLPGKHTALVGSSGSGKSTIANLIMGLYDCTQGQITIGHHDVLDFDCGAIRGCIGFVQQEPILFDRTIFENIALGLVGSSKHAHLRPILLEMGSLSISAQLLQDSKELEPSSKQSALQEIFDLVKHAAVLADADSFIQDLSKSYLTVVGSRGALVSGGQRQRISLARALIRDPEILILDEATASLDSASEIRIQSALARASQGRTTITIAHRLSTIRNAVNIVVLSNGEVVEQGTHEDLIAKAGEYAELLRLQAQIHDDYDSRVSTRSNSSSITSADHVISEKQEIRTASLQPNEAADQENTVKDVDLDLDRSWYSVCRMLFPFIRPKLVVLFFACLAVIIVGGTYSASATIFGNTIRTLSPCEDSSNIRSAGQFYALMFFILAVIEFFANVISWSGFGYVAEVILYRIRILSFRALLEQDLQWHQSAKRSPSSLLGLLTSDVNIIGSLTGSTIATIISIMVNLLAAIVLTHVLAWKFALVCLAAVPLILGAGSMQLIVLSRFAAKHKEAFARSVGIAIESVESIRLVKAYGLPDEILQNYRHSLQGPTREVTRRSLYANMWLALAYGLPTFIYALAYWWGTKLIIAGDITQVQFFIILIALLVSAQLWGQLFTIAPDLTKAVAAAKRVCNLLSLAHCDPGHDLEAVSTQHTTVNGKKQAEGGPGATISFIDVHFSYPARSDVEVLRALNIDIKSGQFAALVGPSGAGKSTIISLIERMYRPCAGQIVMDGADIARLPTTFREDIAVIPQESVMFEGSIKFNISLGARSGQCVTDRGIEEACRIANIHSDIIELPQGYDTPCGTAGASQLSGGQKQRLAIARALVRKPSLLLLDESTSALDAQSEKSFRDGLEAARQRLHMTIVAVAHRLTTIMSADVIFMIEKGQITDHGTHSELMSRCSSYRANAKHQGL